MSQHTFLCVALSLLGWAGSVWAQVAGAPAGAPAAQAQLRPGPTLKSLSERSIDPAGSEVMEPPPAHAPSATQPPLPSATTPQLGFPVRCVVPQGECTAVFNQPPGANSACTCVDAQGTVVGGQTAP